MIPVHSSDANVTLYLKELKGMYAQINNLSTTQLDNLKYLIDNLILSIDKEKLLEQDRNSYILQEYTSISIQITSINNKYVVSATTGATPSNIQSRYGQYLQSVQNVATFCGFMNLTNYEMSQEMEEDTKELVLLSRYASYTKFQLQQSDDRISYLSDLKTELQNMNFNV